MPTYFPNEYAKASSPEHGLLLTYWTERLVYYHIETPLSSYSDGNQERRSQQKHPNYSWYIKGTGNITVEHRDGRIPVPSILVCLAILRLLV